MTPRELSVYVKAYADAMEEDARMYRAKAYLLASLVRTMFGSKHAPSYEHIFPDDVRKREMNDEEMFAQVQALNRLFGGTEA
jgi:hypothetical protein